MKAAKKNQAVASRATGAGGGLEVNISTCAYVCVWVPVPAHTHLLVPWFEEIVLWF